MQRGFLRYNARNRHYWIDWRESLSLIVGELLLEEILAARPYIHGRLLDVGCGKRPYALIYDPLVGQSVGTEVHFSPHSTDAADLICFAESLPFANASFDTILCTEVLEHTRQPWSVLAEFARILRPQGHVLLSVPFIYPVHEEPHDYWRFTHYGLQAAFAAAGLQPVYVRSKGGPLATLISLGTNIAIRLVNLLSKTLGALPPLRERALIRIALALPQFVYLKGLRRLEEHSRLLDLHSWMTPGYVIIARRGSDTMAPGYRPTSR
jgi:SAM-dependent methyltransferase